MKKENVIKSCYSALRRVTPLNFDCGKICNGKCCKGDEKTGMLLFPGEEKLIDPDINVIETDSGDKLAVCNGICDRNRRPLSCRIYPLFPIVSEEGNIDVIFDLRADCPLSEGEYQFSRRFVKGVKRVGKYLLLNGETATYYKELCHIQNEQIELIKKFQKNS